MDSNIIIDDDFTVDVIEDDDVDCVPTETYHIKTEKDWDAECDVEFAINTDVEIKQEFDIDIEDNYLTTDEFIDILEIKTEIESQIEENETETSNDQLLPTVSETPDTAAIADDLHFSSDNPPVILPENDKVDSVPENIPNPVTSSHQPSEKEDISAPKSTSVSKQTCNQSDNPPLTLLENDKVDSVPENIPNPVTSHQPSEKEDISAPKATSVSKQTCNQASTDLKQKPTALPSNKPQSKPLDRRKQLNNKKNHQQIAKVPLGGGQKWQSYNERSVVPFKYNHRKPPPSKYNNQPYQMFGPYSASPNQYFQRRPRFTKFAEAETNGIQSHHTKFTRPQINGIKNQYTKFNEQQTNGMRSQYTKFNEPQANGINQYPKFNGLHMNGIKKQYTKFPKPHPNGIKNQYGTWNNDSNAGMFQKCPPVYETPQNTFDMNTYNTILNALNQIVQQNQNNSMDVGNSASVVPHRYNRNKRHFSHWSRHDRRRPEVWAPEVTASTPHYEASSAQMQTYTTILQAVSQLSSGLAGQNCENYTTFAHNLKLEMSVLNVHGSY